MTDAFGTINWWGFSPSLDLQDDIMTSLQDLQVSNDDTSKELNIVLIGSGDVRHLLTTAARAYRHQERKIHFYILENNLELYARDLLLLSVSFESQRARGLQEKTELFLELFGNVLIRQQSCDYVQKMAKEFIKMVTDFDYLEKKLPFIDLTELKFKERDYLEAIFKFWRKSDNNIFDVGKYWDLRVRHHLGVRYDSRLNVFDWDYHMRLLEKGAEVINKAEYKKWREGGVAFEPREGTYDVPNKTLASGMILKQGDEKVARRGFWGDILVSPYISFGIESEEKSLFKKQNDQYMQTSQKVAEYNLMSLFHELTSKTKYVPVVVEEPEKPPKIVEVTEEEELVAEQEHESEEVEPDTVGEAFEIIPVDNIKVTFLPLNSVSDLAKRKKYCKLFHVVYFSNSLVHLLTPEVNPLFADKATIILETAKFMLELKAEQCREYATKIKAIAKHAGCTVAEPFTGDKDAFGYFHFTRSETS